MAQRKKSNMQKNFEKHAEGGLRCMADGGLVPPKKPGLIESIGTTLQSAMPMPQVPAANIPQPLNTLQPTQPGKLPVKSGNPMPGSGSPLPSTASVPVRAADGGEIVKQYGLRAALRSGEAGRVVGPGGPREDKVHAKLSAGEYVLPAKTVEAMGGAEALDAYVRETNDGREPNPTLRMAGGGMVPYNPIVGQAPGPVVQPAPVPPRITSAPNPNVDPVRGSAEMRDFMSNNPRAPGGGSPLPDVSPADATSVASKGLRFVARAAPAAAAGAGLTGAVQSVAEPFTNPEKVQNFATNLGLGAEKDDSPAWQAVKETGAQGLRVLQNIGDATGAGYLGRAIARKIGGENFFDTGSAAAPAARPAAAAATAPAAAAPAASGASDMDSVDFWMKHIENGGTPPINGTPAYQEASRRMFENALTTGVERGADGNVTKMAMTNMNNMGKFPESRQTMQTQEGRQATLRAAYAPTQYRDEPSTNPALRRDDLHAGANFGDSGGINNPNSWDWMATRKDRRMAQEREANQNNNATLRRGQDMSYAGDAAKANALTQKANIDAASEASKAQRDQANKDREFNAAQKKQTAEEGRAQQTARAQASETQRKDIESRFRMKDGDGKDVPDTARAASYYAAAAKTLPAMITALRAQGSPEALAKAQVLTEKGVGALEPGDHDQLTDLFNRRDQMSKAAGIGPNQGTYKHSDNLLDYMQVQGPKGVEKRVFGGNRVNTPAGSVSVNDLKYKDGPANRILPDWFKTQNIDGTRGLRTE